MEETMCQIAQYIAYTQWLQSYYEVKDAPTKKFEVILQNNKLLTNDHMAVYPNGSLKK